MTAMPMRLPRMSPWVFDGLLAVSLLAVGLISLTEPSTLGSEVFTRDPDALNVVLVIVMTAPVVLRRRYPTVVLAIVALAWGVERFLDYPPTLGLWSIPLALHAVGSELPRERSTRIAALTVIVLVAFTALGAMTAPSVGWSTVIVVGAFTIIPYVLGREVHERRRRTAELEQRTAELEQRREQEARRAVRAERQRIARELHDIVAHDMTVMTVQASAARRLLPDDPVRAIAALQAVEEAGHEALDEMRRLLDVLRPQATEPNRTPQPGLGRLDELIRQMQDAGLDVTVSIDGVPTTLPAGIDLNAYRIIQESLTNALKHGGPSTTAHVSLRYADNELEIEVNDDGRGAAVALGGNGAAGRGLVGMRERVTLLHGDITYGPRPGGGYRVRTSIPLNAP